MGVQAVIDTSAVIKRLLDYDYEIGYVTPGVVDEIRDEETRKYFGLHSHKIEVREPSEESIREARELAASLGNTALGRVDLEVCALALTLSRELGSSSEGWMSPSAIQIICLSGDCALRNVLLSAGVWTYDEEKEISLNRFVFRCYACKKEFGKETLFCTRCGYNTITRVSYREEEGKRVLNLKQNFRYEEKKFRTRTGIEIRSADQREYSRWARSRK
jgi:rRNA maturation endonuclease Nob1